MGATQTIAALREEIARLNKERAALKDCLIGIRDQAHESDTKGKLIRTGWLIEETVKGLVRGGVFK